MANFFNEQIPLLKFKLIGQEGNLLGEFTKSDALQMAQQNNCDLILIGPDVVKMGDIGKYLYDLKQKLKKTKQKTSVQKKIQLSLKIDKNDLNTKKNHIIKFLQEGNSVQLVVLLRRKELPYAEKGIEMLLKLSEELAEYGKSEKQPAQSGNQIILILSKKKKN